MLQGFKNGFYKGPMRFLAQSQVDSHGWPDSHREAPRCDLLELLAHLLQGVNLQKKLQMA